MGGRGLACWYVSTLTREREVAMLMTIGLQCSRKRKERTTKATSSRIHFPYVAHPLLRRPSDQPPVLPSASPAPAHPSQRPANLSSAPSALPSQSRLSSLPSPSRPLQLRLRLQRQLSSEGRRLSRLLRKTSMLSGREGIWKLWERSESFETSWTGSSWSFEPLAGRGLLLAEQSRLVTSTRICSVSHAPVCPLQSQADTNRRR